MANCLVGAVLFALSTSPSSAQTETAWRAGVATVNITPREPIWLAGFGGRHKPHEGVVQDIYVKALALEDGSGRPAVILTSDLVGLSTQMVDTVAARVQAAYQLSRERLILNYSHNHSGPVTGDVLHLYQDLPPEQKAAVARYTAKLLDQMVAVIGDALQDLAPARVAFGRSQAGFAVNRRRIRPGGHAFPAPVDHDVPVLAVHRPEGALRAILFGYACHTTALSGYTVNGDYAGFAQHELEAAFPGATALFLMGCGGDANPLPRIAGSDGPEAMALTSGYGHQLATAVGEALRGRMQPVQGPLRVAYEETRLPLQAGPTRAELAERAQSGSPLQRRASRYLLEQLEREGAFPESVPYPVQVWQFGRDLKLIALTGETVVDYALRFKKHYGAERTWVAGYNNNILNYIPSLRVLREGGYEGTLSHWEYGLPAPFAESVEEIIAETVEKLVQATAPSRAAPALAPAGDWQQVAASTAYRPRDSSGEVVFRDHLWLLGGWFDSYETPPRDVWKSADGVTWELATHQAPWKHSDFPMTTVFQDRMWLVGGWYNGRLPNASASNQVWSSPDGKNWELITERAGWTPRMAGGLVAFKGKLWILGGQEKYYFGDASNLKNDVWNSADGRTWHQVTAAAPWPARAYHQVQVFQGKLWVFGGGNYLPEYQAYNDVWCSEDGINWTQVSAQAAWPARLWFSSAVYRNRLWVLGGWSKVEEGAALAPGQTRAGDWNDVWHSRDGRTWERLETATIWKARHEHSAYVFRDKLWITAGHARPLTNDVWALELPPDF